MKTSNNRREAMLKSFVSSVLLREVKAKFIRHQAEQGEITPNGKKLIGLFMRQIENIDRRKDENWVKNTKEIITKTATAITNQAMMIQWANAVQSVKDDDDAPEMPDEDHRFGETVRQHMIEVLSDVVKRAASGSPVTEDQLTGVIQRVIQNVAKTFKITAPKTQTQQPQTTAAE